MLKTQTLSVNGALIISLRLYTTHNALTFGVQSALINSTTVNSTKPLN